MRHAHDNWLSHEEVGRTGTRTRIALPVIDIIVIIVLLAGITLFAKQVFFEKTVIASQKIDTPITKSINKHYQPRYENEVLTTSQVSRPQTLLEKYSWYIVVATDLEKLRTEMIIHQWKVTTMELLHYFDTKWIPEDIERYNNWTIELFSLKNKASLLSAKYNEEMKKDGCPFKTFESLPEGASLLLPCKINHLGFGIEDLEQLSL